MQSAEAQPKTSAESPLESRLSSLLKESKTLRARLRLKRQEVPAPKSPALELARKSLRNVYLKLLFNFPFSSRTGGVEVDIWTETCHPGVGTYRTLLSHLEKQCRALQSKRLSMSSRQVPSVEGDIQSLHRQESQVAQKYVRTAASFRLYLAEEETFWRELVGRIVRVFNVEEAKPHVQALQIACDRLAILGLGDEGRSSTGLTRVDGADNEGGDLEVQGRFPANRQRLIAIIHKGLLCCGDLARYRELYREEKAEEKAPSRGAHRGGKRGGKGGSASARPTVPIFNEIKAAAVDYSKAAQCYEQARALLPSNGQPSNQIAVLATYVGHSFAAVYHYYRALCVSVPFDRAKQNLELMLRRAVERWESQERVQTSGKPWDEDEKKRLDLFNDLVVLHGQFFLTRQEPVTLSFLQHCHQMLSSLVVEKALAADTIVQIVVAAIASLWTRRLWRGVSNKEDGASVNNVNSEQAILLHLVGVMKVLVEVGSSETREALELAKRHPTSDLSGSDQSLSMARNITAAFRRMLPALRIASKWLKSHVEYVERSRNQPRESQDSNSNEESTDSHRRELSEAVSELWVHYVAFINIIRFAFPFNQLPKLGTLGQSGMTSLNFEEDRDMRGFVPMKKAMLIDARNDGVSNEMAENQLHPNEEHLIRIADILIDAKVIAESDSSPIAFDNGQNHFNVSSSVRSQTDSSLAKSSVVVVSGSDQGLSRSHDSSNWENGSESTEDAVDLAMRAVDERRRALGKNSGNRGRDEEEDNDGDDGEIILIPSSARQGQGARSDVSTASPSGSVKAIAPVKDTSSEEPLTAQHLLLKMINGNPPTRTNLSPSPSTPQPQLLFGGIASTTSQSSFTSLAHHGGAWDGNEAVQFMNQQQRQQSGHPLPYPTFASNSPWDPPTRDAKGADWR